MARLDKTCRRANTINLVRFLGLAALIVLGSILLNNPGVLLAGVALLVIELAG